MLPLRDSIPSSRLPVVNGLLIVVNVLVFVYEAILPPEQFEQFIFTWAAIPAAFNPSSELFDSPVISFSRLITSMFLHGGIAHVGFNMLFLWVFGDNVEDRLGHLPYLFFYLACGIVAAGTQVLFSLESTIPIVGASGAIGGVMGAYMIAYPNAKVLTFFWFFLFLRFFWVPALFYLGLWFLFQIMQAVTSMGLTEAGAQGGVAFWAHVGGFVAGMLFVLIIKKKPPRRRRRFAGDDFSVYSSGRYLR